MGTNGNYWKEIADCVDYIELEVHKGSPYSKISSGIDQRYNTRSRVVREAFNACMPYSLGRYIRRRLYTIEYLKWQRNPVKLTVRDGLGNVREFTKKFSREFGFELRESLNESDLQPKLEVEETRQMHQILSSVPVIKSYKLSRDMVQVEEDRKEVLKHLLRLDSYFLPECMENKFRQFDADMKMLFLIVTTHAINSKRSKIHIPVSQLQAKLDTGRFYDFRQYYLLGNGLMVFVPNLTSNLYCEFQSCCEELLPNIRSVLPVGTLHGNLKKELDVISRAGTLKELSEETRINDPRPLIWQYLQWGYLRLRDNNVDNYS